MPKSIVLTPETLLAEDRIRFAEIPVNSYSRSVAEERSVLTPQDFLAIWQDMCAIREFEIILNEIKIKRAYQGRRLRSSRTRAPLDRAGSRGRRDGLSR